MGMEMEVRFRDESNMWIITGRTTWTWKLAKRLETVLANDGLAEAPGQKFRRPPDQPSSGITITLAKGFAGRNPRLHLLHPSCCRYNSAMKDQNILIIQVPLANTV